MNQNFSLGEKRLCNLFSRLTGKSSYKQFPNTAVALVTGVAVQFDEAGKVAVSATDKTNVGVTVAAAALSTTATVDVIDPNSIWRCTTFTGTYDATKIGTTCDITAGLTPVLANDTNHDVTIVGGDVANNSYIDVVFNNAGLVRTEVGAA